MSIHASRTDNTGANSEASHEKISWIISMILMVRAKCCRDTDHHLTASHRPVFVTVRMAIEASAWRTSGYKYLLHSTSLEGPANYQCRAIDKCIMIGETVAIA